MEKNNNIFAALPQGIKEEVFETLLNSEAVKIERIVSPPAMQPHTEWFDQSTDEWVVLLEGSASILFEKDRRKIKLEKGDYCFIPAGIKHKVIETKAKQQSIWLAIHISKKRAT